MLDGGAGADTLGGGPGTDTATYASRTTALAIDLDNVADDGDASDQSGSVRDNVGDGVENLIGGTGADTLTGSAYANVLDGGTGADTITGLTGTDTVTYAGRTAAVAVDVDNVADDGGTADQTGAVRDNVKTDVENLTGGAGADTLTGSAAVNVIDGGAGADVLSGLGGADTVSYATRGIAVTVDIDDAADDGSTSDQTGTVRDNVRPDVESVIGSPLNDRLTGGAANNTLDGRGGNDVLDGGPGADDMLGGTGTDAVTYAGRAAAVVADIDGFFDDGSSVDQSGTLRDNVRTDVDNLIGGNAADTLTGSVANNVLDGGPGADSMHGGNGTDTVTYASRTSAVTVDLDDVADDGDASDQTGTQRDNARSGIENVIGGASADTLTGSALNNTFDGGPGADTFTGLAGVDNVTYASRLVAVIVDIDGVADDGDSSDQTGAVRDNVKTDVENLTGGAGGDTLTGSAAANQLGGGAGADSFSGLAGNDVINARNDDLDSSFQCGENPSDNDVVNADLTPNEPVTAGTTNCEQVNKT